VQVSPSLVKRCKNHMHNLLCGTSIILGRLYLVRHHCVMAFSMCTGNNGYIWISPSILEPDPSSTTDETSSTKKVGNMILFDASFIRLSIATSGS